MKASEKIKDRIKRWVGLKLAAYLCSGGVWTIGYGHTGPEVKQDMVINPAIAQEMFDADVARHEQELNALLTAHGVKLKQNQFDALLSFVFNLGIGNLRESTLFRKLKVNPADPTIPDEFRRWVYAKGVKLPGLVQRRQTESEIYADEL